MNVTIRQAVITDFEVICQNEQSSYLHPWSNNMLRESIQGKATSVKLYDCFVMLKNEAIIGHLICQNILDEVHLHNVCVLPTQQGNGFGKQWLVFLNEYAKELKAKYILLEVRESNLTAKKLYEKMNYREIGFRKKYYKSGTTFENAIVMKAVMLYIHNHAS